MSVPVPAPSPVPPVNPPERTQTGELRAVVEPMLAAHDNKLTVRSVLVAIGAVAVGVAAAFVFIDNRVLAQTSQASQVQADRHDALKARVETLEKRFDRYDAKLDLALDALRVPQSARPPPFDGGGP